MPLFKFCAVSPRICDLSFFCDLSFSRSVADDAVIFGNSLVVRLPYEQLGSAARRSYVFCCGDNYYRVVVNSELYRAVIGITGAILHVDGLWIRQSLMLDHYFAEGKFSV